MGDHTINMTMLNSHSSYRRELLAGAIAPNVCDDVSPAMTTAAANAAAAGISIFASSGNDGYCSSMSWPACISYVNSVGAVYDEAFGAQIPCVSSASCGEEVFVQLDFLHQMKHFQIKSLLILTLLDSLLY